MIEYLNYFAGRTTCQQDRKTKKKIPSWDSGAWHERLAVTDILFLWMIMSAQAPAHPVQCSCQEASSLWFHVCPSTTCLWIDGEGMHQVQGGIELHPV